MLVEASRPLVPEAEDLRWPRPAIDLSWPRPEDLYCLRQKTYGGQGHISHARRVATAMVALKNPNWHPVRVHLSVLYSLPHL